MRLATTIVVFIVWSSVSPTPVLADTTFQVGSGLPPGAGTTLSASAVFDRAIFIFGGLSGGAATDRIVRVDPATGETALMAARLPTPRYCASAVQAGTGIYVIGGRTDSLILNEILFYVPGSDTISPAPGGLLPKPLACTSAVWTGEQALIFGGIWESSVSDKRTSEIHAYLPSTRVARTVLENALPTARSHTSAVWTGEKAIIIGGEGVTGGPFGEGGPIGQVVLYDPSGDTIEVPTEIPTNRSRTAAVWDGASLLVFGGRGSGDVATDEILKITFGETASVSRMSKRLPGSIHGGTAQWIDKRAYVIGGGADARTAIIGYDLAPSPPTEVAVSYNESLARIDLRWRPPPNDTYSGFISSFVVYRGQSRLDIQRLREAPPTEFCCAEDGQLSFQDSEPLRSDGRQYSVSAVTVHGEGAPSETVGLSLPPESPLIVRESSEAVESSGDTTGDSTTNDGPRQDGEGGAAGDVGTGNEGGSTDSPLRPDVFLLGAFVLASSAALFATHLRLHAVRKQPFGPPFKVLKKLGEGTFSQTYLVQDLDLGRRAVIKQLREEWAASNPDAANLFRSEGERTARVKNERVVTVYRLLSEARPPALVLEYVEGGTLDNRLREPFPLRRAEAWRISSDILDGLAAIHAESIIHRDLKPANILLDRQGRAKITDFGISRGPDVTRAATIFNAAGTPGFISPEQARGLPPDVRSDIYSAGVVLQRLFRHVAWPISDASSETHPSETIEDASAALSRIPDDLDAVLRKAAATDPRSRHANAVELRDEIDRCLSEDSSRAGP